MDAISQLVYPVLALSMAMLIAVLSLAPGDSKAVGWMPSWLQNVGHFGCYGLLGGLLALALLSVAAAPVAVIAAVVLASAFGIFMEWMQRGAAGRTPSWIDAVNDAFGATVGASLAVAILG